MTATACALLLSVCAVMLPACALLLSVCAEMLPACCDAARARAIRTARAAKPSACASLSFVKKYDKYIPGIYQSCVPAQ